MVSFKSSDRIIAYWQDEWATIFSNYSWNLIIKHERRIKTCVFRFGTVKRGIKTPLFAYVSHCTANSPTRIDRTASVRISLRVRPIGMTHAGRRQWFCPVVLPHEGMLPDGLVSFRFPSAFLSWVAGRAAPGPSCLQLLQRSSRFS